MKDDKRWVVAVHRDQRASSMVIRNSRPSAVMELERIGKIRDVDRARIRLFLEGSVNHVAATLSSDWTGSGWIRELNGEES